MSAAFEAAHNEVIKWLKLKMDNRRPPDELLFPTKIRAASAIPHPFHIILDFYNGYVTDVPVDERIFLMVL